MTGDGQEVRIPLADVGIATVANLGMLAEVLETGRTRERLGNEVYGAFGRDFLTRDGQRLMVMAITPRQWSGLVAVLGIGETVAEIEAARGVTFAKDEGVRFEHRDALYPLVERSVVQRDASELGAALDARHCWGRYQPMSAAVCDPVLVGDNPVFADIDHPSGRRYPASGAMATLPGLPRRTAVRAPRLGEHSDAVLADVLRLGSGAIGSLHDRGIVAAASAPPATYTATKPPR